MRKSKRKMTYAAKKRIYARRIVRLCKMIAKKDVSNDLTALVEDYIVTKLPASLMLRLVQGRLGTANARSHETHRPFFA